MTKVKTYTMEEHEISGECLYAVELFKKAERLRERADELEAEHQKYVNAMPKNELGIYVKLTTNYK